jgi:hypothetical protein
MKRQEIRELLEKYYEATSTQLEEQNLLEYFTSGIISDEFLNDRDLFLSLYTMSEGNTPDVGFDSRLESKVMAQISTRNHHKYRSLYRAVLSSAAVALISLVLWYAVASNRGPSDTFSSPELAYMETLKALHRVSTGISSATAKLKPLESFNTAKESIKSIGETGDLFERGVSELQVMQRHLTNKDLDNK